MLAVAAIAALGLACDLASKAWAWEVLRRHRPRRIVDGVLHFELAFNTGSAFGFLRDAAWSRWVFVAITIAALAYALRAVWRWSHPSALVPIAIGLMVGGALGNLHDRLLRVRPVLGHLRHGVVDFIVVFYWPGRRWPAFNIADVLLVVGMAMLVLGLWRARPMEPA